MAKLTKYLQRNRYLLGFGFLLAFLSSFGQTFLISLYVPGIQKAFDLSNGLFSSIYAGATIASAFTITWLGSFIDEIRLTKFTILMMLGLIFFMGLLSISYYIPLLFLSIYGLRLFGQGMMSHTAVTSMARFYDDGRGKAISLANLGHPLGEAILPILIVSVMYYVGWRYTILTSVIVVVLSMPYAIYLLRKNSNFKQLRKYIPAPFSAEERKQSRPREVIRTKAFWIIMPASLASASIGTGFLLFKLKLGLSNDWAPTFIAAGFTAYAAGNALSNVLAGFLSDRFSGRAMFPIYLLPASVGFICLMFSDSEWVYLALVGGIGITNGFGGTTKNVALAEVYGTRIIGSVRSLFTTVMVFSTALGPLAFGLLLDAGYDFSDIAFFALIFYLLCTVNSLRILGKSVETAA
jgi:MFS family permease